MATQINLIFFPLRQGCGTAKNLQELLFDEGLCILLPSMPLNLLWNVNNLQGLYLFPNSQPISVKFQLDIPNPSGFAGSRSDFSEHRHKIDGNCQEMLPALAPIRLRLGFLLFLRFISVAESLKCVNLCRNPRVYRGCWNANAALDHSAAGGICDPFYSPVKTSAAPLAAGICWQLHHSFFAFSKNPNFNSHPSTDPSNACTAIKKCQFGGLKNPPHHTAAEIFVAVTCL